MASQQVRADSTLARWWVKAARAAVTAVILTIAIAVLAVIKPVAALGLSPVLIAIAAIIRAIRGGPDPE